MRRVGRAKTINTKYRPEERENFFQAQVPTPARLHEAMLYTLRLLRLLPRFYRRQPPFPRGITVCWTIQTRSLQSPAYFAATV
jgi:hypothetical protein